MPTRSCKLWELFLFSKLFSKALVSYLFYFLLSHSWPILTKDSYLCQLLSNQYSTSFFLFGKLLLGSTFVLIFSYYFFKPHLIRVREVSMAFPILRFKVVSHLESNSYSPQATKGFHWGYWARGMCSIHILSKNIMVFLLVTSHQAFYHNTSRTSLRSFQNVDPYENSFMLNKYLVPPRFFCLKILIHSFSWFS